MPDLTIENMQMCESIREGQVFNEGGYTQTDIFTERRQPHCTCPAFFYSRGALRSCKHIKAVSLRACGWHQQYGVAQTQAQHEANICPECGGKTINVRVGV